MVQIESYQLNWHPSQGAAFRIKAVGAGAPSRWFKVTAADLAAVAAILRESPCYFNPDDGVLTTGAEEPKS